MNDRWTKDMDAALARLVSKGLSFSQIADALSTDFNRTLTRNSTIGRAHRLGIKPAPKRAAPARARGRQLFSPAMDDRLRDLWASDKSGAEIAAELGRPESTVRTRAAFLRLPARSVRYAKAWKPESTTLEPDDDRPAQAAPIAPLPEPEVGIPISLHGVRLMDLAPHHCRFPLGGPQERAVFFCGQPKAIGDVYCRHHCRIAYAPLRPRVRKKPEPTRPGRFVLHAIAAE